MLVLLILVSSDLMIVSGSASVQVEGVVNGPDGAPLPGAKILLWGYNLEAETITDDEGQFQIGVQTTESTCTLYAFYDDPSSDGFEYMPYALGITTDSDVEELLEIVLQPAATILVVGQLRPMESTSNILTKAFEVVDPEDGHVLSYGAFSLIYGTGMNVQSYFLGLDSSTLIVPIDRPLAIRVSSAYQYERSSSSRRRGYGWGYSRLRVVSFSKFTMVEGDGFQLGAGEVASIDIRKYSISDDLERLVPMRETVETNITQLEALGFYTASERHEIKNVNELLESASVKLAGAAYEEAYIALRQAYLKLTGVKGRLASIVVEAATSMRLLVGFIALTSIVLASLLTERSWTRILLTVSLYFPLIIYVYRVYPGSASIEDVPFAISSTVTILIVLAIVALSPRFTKWSTDRGFTTGETIIPILSMAKRSLRRRRLRLAFTLSSILVLTMSFVALTSLSTSYGLVYYRSGTDEPSVGGIMMRMPEYDPNGEFEKGWFYPIISYVVEWAKSCESVVNVALKAENYPAVRPYGRIGETSIFGILGLQIEGEPLIANINDCIVEGEPIKADGECLLHRYASRVSGVEIEDTVTIKGVPLKVVGFFDDSILKVIDTDGESILPKYQVIVNPGDEIPIVEVWTCDPKEVVIANLETAQGIGKVYVSRIDMELEPGADTDVLVKSMALSREYRFWAASGGVAHAAFMGSQIGGKGLPILVPWTIAMLNVVVTMLNSMYERRKEINILSSIGLNPGHISGIFIAEATIIGVIGGGLGYLLGLGWYPLMAQFSFAPVVAQKVSIGWCVAALGISVSSVVFGALIAQRRSTELTPSKSKKWFSGGKWKSKGNEWEIPLPLLVEEESLDAFIDFLLNRLSRYGNPEMNQYIRVKEMRRGEKGEPRTLEFSYIEGQMSIGCERTNNVLSLNRSGSGVWSINLKSVGSRYGVDKTGTLIRGILIQWSTIRRRDDTLGPGV